jgi:hypothetical protein
MVTARALKVAHALVVHSGMRASSEGEQIIRSGRAAAFGPR